MVRRAAGWGVGREVGPLLARPPHPAPPLTSPPLCPACLRSAPAPALQISQLFLPEKHYLWMETSVFPWFHGRSGYCISCPLGGAPQLPLSDENVQAYRQQVMKEWGEADAKQAAAEAAAGAAHPAHSLP